MAKSNTENNAETKNTKGALTLTRIHNDATNAITSIFNNKPCPRCIEASAYYTLPRDQLTPRAHM